VTEFRTDPVPDYAVCFEQAGFWVCHRREAFGPFDYQFSPDLDGIEFLYRGEKYGECCSSEEFFADLKPYRLPSRVSQVAAVVTGTLIQCILQGIDRRDRPREIAAQLQNSGLDRYQLTGHASLID